MITLRFYIISMAMILLFFGLGILIGTGLGGDWVDRSYQTIVSNLEKRLTQISLDKERLKEQVTKLEENNQEVRKAWLEFYKERFAPNMTNKKGIVFADSPQTQDWINLMMEAGIHLKTVSYKELDQLYKGDFLILLHPKKEFLEQVAQLNQLPPLVIVATEFYPKQEQGKFFIVPQVPANTKDHISFMQGIYHLLSSR